ncbi:hypothetical protein [Cytobacillus gottheilii]|uniref:hypothetical protein n=1 Tax=Cytobacillus gottheilii TaxID=859144 RepID=UPI002493EACD|nr:hypothetical protein [Cytobacillus gottheilii]
MYFELGEDIVNGTITVNLEGFTAKATDTYHDGEKWVTFSSSNVELSNNGSTIVIKGLSMNSRSILNLQFDFVRVNAGIHTISIITDADGEEGAKSPSEPAKYQYIAR